MPVCKKLVRGVCNVNTFWGISLTSLVSKMVCKILKTGYQGWWKRKVAEKRGCREQLLSLVLLGQIEMVSKPAGMLVAFINFVKVYDNVDRGKLWSCLQSVGMNGRFLMFCMRGASAG